MMYCLVDNCGEIPQTNIFVHQIYLLKWCGSHHSQNEAGLVNSLACMCMFDDIGIISADALVL